MRRKKAEGAPAPPSGETRITPADVQQVEFRLAFRGYNERDVDAFLDRLTEDLGSYMEENRRLRAGAPAASVGAGDVTTAGSEADRILADARTEAERIVRDAEARAAVTGTTADPRGAVAPFLTRERVFLQDLGTLVQGHAEEVKQMVLALRAKAEETSGGETAEPAEPAPVVPSPEEVPAAAIAPPSDVPSSGSEVEDTSSTTAEDAFAPISVPEAEGDEAPKPPAEPAPVQLRRDSGERSLRELFWGED